MLCGCVTRVRRCGHVQLANNDAIERDALKVSFAVSSFASTLIRTPMLSTTDLRVATPDD